MKSFSNSTNDGNERAIKRGKIVPPNGVNLAWAKSPKLMPDKNVAVVDYSQLIPENQSAVQGESVCKIMYANQNGILIDENGSQIVRDEFPAIADVFSIDEDYDDVPRVTSEYKPNHVLPFLHVSRYFHLDTPGLGIVPFLFEPPSSPILKVVRSDGSEYLDQDGNKRYRIQLVQGRIDYVNPSDERVMYRVHVYLDDERASNLFLQYYKVEWDATLGSIKNININFKERLNPYAYYSYVPEEAELFDPSYVRRKQYSTKPIGAKEHIIGGELSPTINGYRVHVPKKAWPDPRMFQVFRWRVRCEFEDQYQKEVVENDQVVRCGVLTMQNKFNSRVPLLFHNLEQTNVNFRDLKFVNPLNENKIISGGKASATYWEVDLETTTKEQLEQFDLLVLAPDVDIITGNDFTAKTHHFVFKAGGTLLYDSNNRTVSTSTPFEVQTGTITAGGKILDHGDYTHTNYSAGTSLTVEDDSHPVLSGSGIGGYDLSEVNPLSFSMRTGGYYRSSKLQVIKPTPDYTTLISTPDVAEPGVDKSVLAFVETGTNNSGGSRKGSIFYTSLGFTGDISDYFSSNGESYRAYRADNTEVQTLDVGAYVNYPFLSELQKLMYNVVLYASRGKSVREINQGENETTFSTKWNGYSDWKASWAIDGDVLSEDERTLYDFSLEPKSTGSSSLVWVRRLSDKSLKELVDEKLGASKVFRLQNATRTYYLEYSNDAVTYPDFSLSGASIPVAYTEVYSPAFFVPQDLGPHIVKGEEVEAVYGADAAATTMYPSRPYRFRIDSSTAKEEASGSQTALITVSGTSNYSYTSTSPTSTSNTKLTWKTHGTATTSQLPLFPHVDYPYPNGIHTWHYANYLNSAFGRGSLSFPFMGIPGVYRRGSRGEIVQFIQQAMNIFKFWGLFPSPEYLKLDGIFGPKTENVVLTFQVNYKQRDRTGIVDAETFSVIGSQILRLGSIIRNANFTQSFEKYFQYPFIYMNLSNVGDGDAGTGWLKRTWTNVGPPLVWETIALRFSNSYPIHSVSIVPWSYGNATSIRWESVHVLNTDSDGAMRNYLKNYDSRNGQYIYMKRRPPINQVDTVGIGPVSGNTIIIGIGQDQPSGFGSSRIFGVKEIYAEAKTSTGGVTRKVTGSKNITYTKTVNVSAERDVYLTATVDPTTNSLTASADKFSALTNVKWTGASSSNAAVRATVVDSAGGRVRIENTASDNFSDSYAYGQEFPANSYTVFSMDKYKNRSLSPESGHISKSDGVKILCNAQKYPHWVPTLPGDADTVTNNAQKGYGEYTIIDLEEDPFVTMGFYDVVEQEFIFNEDGTSSITSEELAARGRENVYVAIVSDYERISEAPIPDANPSKVPFRWAMPVYGVCENTKTKIGIEPVSKNLGMFDIWPIGIRAGNFSKDVNIREEYDYPLSGWVAGYRGKKVRAFYDIPEAKRFGWSSLLGRPYIDIKDETPVILDGSTIQVRQAPIAILQEPSVFQGDYDPARPLFTVYTRSSAQASWTALRWDEILDYKVYDGKITLKSPLPGNQNEDNVKVSYTSKTNVYQFKYSQGQRINLNPYSAVSEPYINKPLYVYMLPAYVLDSTGEVVASSVQTNTLRVTLDPAIFNETHPDYSPLAVQLGVIYVSNGSDIKNLILLDTRARGGGVDGSLTDEESVSAYDETKNFWDVSPSLGIPYQSGGFLIIRLPEAVKANFPEVSASAEIRNIIRKNIPAGVDYKLEYLDGTPWEE